MSSPRTSRALITTDPDRAAAVLSAGGLLGLPTETVYGLAADADDVRAVARIFAVKGRPADHPLIVHLAAADHLDGWAVDIPDYARRLADQLWPGPLTLVLPRSARAGDHVTGGQNTVGIRVPAHPGAQAVLTRLGTGLAAPSANRFGRVSPTTAEHVLAELGDLLDPAHDLILDGGPSQVGVESTIVDCTGSAPVLLRPGGIEAARIGLIGGVEVSARASQVRAPGMLTSHYAPRATVIVTPPDRLGELVAPMDGLLAPGEIPTPPGVVRLSAPSDSVAYARSLYAALREADVLGLSRVIAVPPSPVGLGLAIADRLARAATR